jgi:hypothetical protein
LPRRLPSLPGPLLLCCARGILQLTLRLAPAACAWSSSLLTCLDCSSPQITSTWETSSCCQTGTSYAAACQVGGPAWAGGRRKPGAALLLAYRWLPWRLTCLLDSSSPLTAPLLQHSPFLLRDVQCGRGWKWWSVWAWRCHPRLCSCRRRPRDDTAPSRRWSLSLSGLLCIPWWALSCTVFCTAFCTAFCNTCTGRSDLAGLGPSNQNQIEGQSAREYGRRVRINTHFITHNTLQVLQ